jgi:predicted MFS family arabinose efflux permease
MSKNEKVILLLLAAINFTHILDFMIMMPLGNFLMPYFDISAGEFAAIVASYNFAAFFSGIIAAFRVDRFDRKKVLIVGYAGFLIGTLCCAIAPTYWLLIAARIVAGLFGGLIGAQVLSIVADLIPYERRGRAMSWLMAAFSLASVLGVPFSLYLAKYASWHAPFYLIVGVGMFVFFAVLKYIPSMKGHIAKDGSKKNIQQTFFAVFNIPTQRAALLLSGSLMLGHFLIIPFINPFLEYNMGFSRDQTPMIYLVGGATTIVTGLIWGRLADRFGKLQIFTIAGVLSLIPIYIITHLPDWPYALILALFGFWFAMANGRTIATQAMVSQVVQPENRGSFMSFNSSMQQLFTGAASTIAGLVVYSAADHRIYNYPTLGWMSVGIIAICLLLARRLGVK